MTRDSFNFAKSGFNIADTAFDFREGDNATGNDFYAEFSRQAEAGRSPALFGWKVCGNHANQVVEGNAVVAAGLRPNGEQSIPILNDLYAMTLFLRMGGHFSRLVLSIHGYVKVKLRLDLGSPPAGAAAFAEEVTDYIVCQYTRAADRSPKAIAAFTMNVQKMFKNLNGLPGQHGELVVYTRGLVLEFAAVNQEVSDSIVQVLFRMVPDVPQGNKWTKLGPCLDFYHCANLFGILCGVQKIAFRKIVFTAKVIENTLGDADGPHRNTANWHAVAGHSAIMLLMFLELY